MVVRRESDRNLALKDLFFYNIRHRNTQQSVETKEEIFWNERVQEAEPCPYFYRC